MKDPWWMYQCINGEVVSHLFDPDKIPKGWHDSPRAAKAARKPKKIDGRSKEAKSLKAQEDGDSSGLDKQLSETSGDTGGGSVT